MYNISSIYVDDLDGGTDNHHKATTIRWKIRQPVKNDDVDEEEEWRHEWKQRIYSYGDPKHIPPLVQMEKFKKFQDDVFGRKQWSPRAERWWTQEFKEEQNILAEARRPTIASSDQFKRLFVIRKAKREC
jgi:hypothetical protein